MNYRHIYHAGNFADVFKHIMLMLVLEYLRKKDKPFFVLDTHGGIGLYDLQAVEAQKTQEAAAGVGRLWARQDKPEAVKRYGALIKQVNKGRPRWSMRPDSGGVSSSSSLSSSSSSSSSVSPLPSSSSSPLPRFYPGSPLVAQALLRPQDRLVVNELHPEDVKTLRRAMGADTRVRVTHEDGYILLKSQLPPAERRGVVLIDPPFEVRDEFERLVKGITAAYKRWATGTYIIWYPIKDMALIADFHDRLRATGIPHITAIDFLCRAPQDTTLFNGSGLAIINPPWTLSADADTILPWLVEGLTAGQGSYKTTIIAGETP